MDIIATILVDALWLLAGFSIAAAIWVWWVNLVVDNYEHPTSVILSYLLIVVYVVYALLIITHVHVRL